MRWAAGIIFYNDAVGLQRCLGSLCDAFDRVYCVDGRYPNFPGSSWLSTDGSRELVRDQPNAVLVDAGGVYQPEKRNRYLELAGRDDISVLLTIDSDEYVHGDLPGFMAVTNELVRVDDPTPMILRVPGRNMDTQSGYAIRRLQIRPGNLRLLSGVHYDFFDITKSPPAPIPIDRSGPIVGGVEVRQDDTVRSDEWLASMFEQQKWQILYEWQWQAPQRRIFREHVERHGLDAIDILLQNHPTLANIVRDYGYRKVPPTRPNQINPEFDEYARLIREYIEICESDTAATNSG